MVATAAQHQVGPSVSAVVLVVPGHPVRLWRSANAGTAGVSGVLLFESGVSTTGASGSVTVASGQGANGKGGDIMMSVGSGE